MKVSTPAAPMLFSDASSSPTPYWKLMSLQDESFLRGVSDLHPSFFSPVVAGISRRGISSLPLASPNLNSLYLATVHSLERCVFVASAPVSFLEEKKDVFFFSVTL